MKPNQYVQNYAILGELGDGGQANVYLTSYQQQLYAVKVYKPGKSKLQSFKKQVQFLSKLKHQHLINIVECKAEAKVKFQGKEEELRPIIVLQYASGGELFDLLAKDGGLKPEFCRTLFKQLISSIQYLQSQGVSHRDIKPENILFDKHFNLKISDFGLAIKSQTDFLTSRLGTTGYKSPEMEVGKYNGLQADMFAAGVTLFILYNGSPPFPSTKSTDKIYRHIKDHNFAKFWSLHEKKKAEGFYSPEFKKLINSFFSFEPEKRPTLENLKEYDWMNGPSATQEQLAKELRSRFDHFVEEDEKKKELQKIKCQILTEKVKQSERQEIGDDVRSIPESFLATYHEHAFIEVEDLPLAKVQEKLQLNHKPAFIIAWITEFLKKAQKNGELFMKENCFEIDSQRYSVEFDEEDKKIEIQLNYHSHAQEVEELQLIGQMYKMKNRSVSVDWARRKGNNYWLSNVIHQLNYQLKYLC